MPYSPELRRQIEELALRLVVGDPAGEDAGKSGPAWVPHLERIRESALLEQAAPVAVEAAIVSAIQDAGGGEPGTAPFDLQEGVARLQAVLEAEAEGRAVSYKSPAQDAELLGDFILESREHLAAIEAQVLTLEREPGDVESLNAVFRGFHTIKGLAGFLELWDVQKLAHEVEAVLDRARESQWTITGPAIDVILQSADYLRRWVAHLEAVLQGRPSEAPPGGQDLIPRIRALCVAARPEPSSGEPAPQVPDSAAVPEPETAAPTVAAAGRPNQAAAVRVDTAKLDYLADMAGEMVIAESLVRHDPSITAVINPGLQRKMAQLARITAELQKTAMAMRLVTIGPLFRRMARLVRDLSRQFGKQVEIVTEGDEIELDRTIVEELADPFMHMVRNALDHGIETPAERVERGKSPSARLQLKARHQAGQVVIEIADDGRGLDREKIRAKAIQKGLVTAEQELSEAETYGLIFRPGFTTAAQVTNVSGRGVGMDVVRRHIEKLRGRIEIRSSQGSGATFTLKLPLTLAIIDGLTVGVGQERYIVPLFAVREMFRPSADTVWTVRQKVEMALVRDVLLPVLRLHRRFGVEPRSEDPLESVLLVVEAEGTRFCLLVDQLIGKQEVVIKSLGETFQKVAGIAGGAILGDGRVGLILDLDRLFKERTGDASR